MTVPTLLLSLSPALFGQTVEERSTYSPSSELYDANSKLTNLIDKYYSLETPDYAELVALGRLFLNDCASLMSYLTQWTRDLEVREDIQNSSSP